MRPAGKLCDLTGPGLTDRFGMTSTDLGASVRATNGDIVSVFGDTFSGNKVGHGSWRSPVVLIGSGDATTGIRYHRAGGPDPRFAQQLWPYAHGRRISTVIPSDLLRVDDTLYLHAIVNRGFGNVVWTEIWRSLDGGIRWQRHGRRTRFGADLHRGHAQCWSWDYDPDDGWVYVVSTGFQRDKGIILRRVRPEHIGRPRRYMGWDSRLGWGHAPTPITPDGETWGELSLRRLAPNRWVLGGFVSSAYALGYRVVTTPATELSNVVLQLPLRGSSWDDEDHAHGRVAQLYGGYLMPGSELDTADGVGLIVSQWNTREGWPYRVMQFRATLEDTTTSGGRSR